MKSLIHVPIALWESVQVELHGSYSTTRVLELAKYESSTSLWHEMWVLLCTPLPCLATTLLIDVLPLGKPSDGVAANKMFFVREYFIFLVMTFFAIHQFRVGVRVLPFPMARAIGYSLGFSAVTVGITYGLIGAVGFPLPFTILAVSPMWLLLTSTAMVFEWWKKVQDNPRAAKMVVGMNKLWLCDTLLAFIYPVYFYIFTALSSDSQTAFSLLLPAIKLCMRNLFARMAEHLKDETPEIVVFNAELFNSLFVSYCMQSSPSFMTTLMMMVANIIIMALSLRDIQQARRGLASLEVYIDNSTPRDRPSTVLGRVSTLLLQEGNEAGAKPTTRAEVIRIASYHGAAVEWDQKANMGSTLTVMPKKMFSASSRSLRYITNSQRQAVVHPTLDELKPAQSASKDIPVNLRYTCKVQRLLYMAEFLILLKYIEVVIPLVFSSYLVVTYQMPNRDYYAIFDGMSQSLLVQTLANVLFYCSLQLASLLLLIVVLKRMLGIRPTTQLAFVLEKQFHWVQISLVFWVFYNAQASLQHCGYDYSFRFAWLSTGTASSQNE